jgi:hypothetical protein
MDTSDVGRELFVAASAAPGFNVFPGAGEDNAFL